MRRMFRESLQASEPGSERAQLGAFVERHRRHRVTGLHILSTRDPASHRTDVVVEHAGSERRAASHMCQIGTERCGRWSAADRVTRLTVTLEERIVAAPQEGVAGYALRLSLPCKPAREVLRCLCDHEE